VVIDLSARAYVSRDHNGEFWKTAQRHDESVQLEVKRRVARSVDIGTV